MVIFRNSTFRNFIAVPALAAAMGACATEPDDASAVAFVTVSSNHSAPCIVATERGPVTQYFS